MVIDHFKNMCYNSSSAIGWIKNVDVGSLLASAALKICKSRQRQYNTRVVGEMRETVMLGI